MTDTLWVGLISGIVGVISVLIPALRAIRKQPTRRTTDAISLVDASGTVIGNLTDEIVRLRRELKEERDRADDLEHRCDGMEAELSKRPTRDELLTELEKRPTREELLDANGKLRRQLIDLGQIPVNGIVKPKEPL